MCAYNVHVLGVILRFDNMAYIHGRRVHTTISNNIRSTNTVVMNPSELDSHSRQNQNSSLSTSLDRDCGNTSFLQSNVGPPSYEEACRDIHYGDNPPPYPGDVESPRTLGHAVNVAYSNNGPRIHQPRRHCAIGRNEASVTPYRGLLVRKVVNYYVPNCKK